MKRAEHKDSRQAEHIEERSTPRTPVIYDVVRRYGEEEMSRPATSLWWSGLAAGLSMSFSLLAEAILRMHITEYDWQLFTENTITVVLPVMAQPSARNFGRAARMWAIVLGANLAGTLFAALFCMFAPVIDPPLRETMLAISAEGMQHGWLEMAFRGVTAGFLMAAMVWLIPAADAAQFWIIVLITYLIGVGDFPHIVAGSVEAFLLVAKDEAAAPSGEPRSSGLRPRCSRACVSRAARSSADSAFEMRQATSSGTPRL